MIKKKLYRGVSQEMFDLNGTSLYPKKVGPFESCIKSDEGHCLDEGFTLDSTEVNSVIKHQKNSDEYPTSGISTTQVYERAQYYALSGDKEKIGYIFTIDRNLLNKYLVKEFIVSDATPNPKIPEDDEVILYSQNDVQNKLPIEVIIKVDKVIK
jgi:hypothetical protein